MYYVYIIQSQKDGSYYKGITENLPKRIAEHNQGVPKYTSKKKPFKLVWYCAFYDKSKALNFEKYLKSGSGFAFSKKRLV